jgi:hypothetical protein
MDWPGKFGRRQTGAPHAYRLLTPEGQTYFDQVLAEFQMLSANPTPDPADTETRKLAGTIAQKDFSARTWSDLFELEASVVKLQPEATLRRSAWLLRAKYKDVALKSEYDAYQTSNPPDAKTASVGELRADALQILRAFHWIYAFNPVRERLRDSVTKLVFWLTCALLVIVLGIAGYGYTRLKGFPVPILPLVLGMGIIGGFISLQRRIQAAPTTGDPILSIAELSNSRFSVYLAPISGAVFAALLYVIFIGGLLKGPLFPEISSPSGSCEIMTASGQGAKGQLDVKCLTIETFSDFVRNTAPASGKDFAILLVWSFIAGFAERFVPDTIDRLVTKANEKSEP